MSIIPLPEKLRPMKLSRFVGQKNIVGNSGVINILIKNSLKTGFFPSLIFWGPPGSGKTTLARIIASELKREYFEFSAVNTSIKDIENIILSSVKIKKEKSGQLGFSDKKISSHQAFSGISAPIIFLDEIHRFNKAQQDKLLPHIERGDIVLIGATTENPSFEVIRPLISRSRVLILGQLTNEDLQKIAKRGLRELKITIQPKALKFLIEASNGDARILLNTLEVASNLSAKKELITEDIETALQRRYLAFDKRGDEFYNVISAFIKSMRASDVNATLYYLARMIAAGQDPLYIARRMVVFASEDIGMAQPTALVVANEVFRACETIGYPECQENLAHGAVYLASAKKDRSAYNAYMAALKDVEAFGNLPVPLKILNAPTKLMKDLGYGKDYEKYTSESLLPEKLKNKKYYIK